MFMIYCSKCGAQLPDDAAFCSACGAAVARAAGAQQQSGAGQGTYQQGYGQGYGNAYVNYNDPAADADANKAYGVLAYLSLLVFVSLFLAPKESKYAKFHTNQGLVLLIAEVALGVGLGIIQSVITVILSLSLLAVPAIIFNAVMGLVWFAASAGIIALIILGIVGAANGQCKPLPVIGKYTILK
jgi:uncharacterized membrane protein